MTRADLRSGWPRIALTCAVFVGACSEEEGTSRGDSTRESARESDDADQSWTRAPDEICEAREEQTVEWVKGHLDCQQDADCEVTEVGAECLSPFLCSTVLSTKIDRAAFELEAKKRQAAYEPDCGCAIARCVPRSGLEAYCDNATRLCALRRPATSFWEPFQGADVDWVESKPTLKALAESADLVVLARVGRVTLGTEIQGDAEEDVYLEADLELDPTETVRGTGPEKPVLTLMLTTPTRADAESAVEQINKLGLDDPALFLLRRRESGKYRVLNGQGIWVATGASFMTPLVQTKPETELYDSEVSEHKTLSELAASLR